MTTVSHVPRFRWKSLFGIQPGLFFLCLAVWTLTNMDQALFGYAIPGILAEFHLPITAAGTILTVSFVVAAGFIILAGIAADRWGRGTVTVVLLISSAVAVAGQGVAGGVVTLTLFRAFGFGLSGGLSPTTNAIAIDNAVPRYRGVTAGFLQCGYPLGWFLASLFAAPMLDQLGWRAICFGALIIIPLAVPLGLGFRFYGALGRPAPHISAAKVGRPRIATLFDANNRRNSLAISALFFMFGGAYAGSAFFFPTFFAQERGYSAAEAASLVGLSNAIAVFGYLTAALAGEFVMSRRTVFVIWCVGGALALLGLLWSAHGRTQDLLWYGIMAALFFGSQAVVIVLAAELFPPTIRATAIALCGSAPLSLGFAVFPMIVPIVVMRVGWQVGLSVIIVPLLIGAALAALLLPNRPSGQETSWGAQSDKSR